MPTEEKRRVLVTGGTGYIGSHTIVELQLRGYEVIVIDNLSNSHAWVLEHIAMITGIKPSFYKVDMAESEQLDAFFKSVEPIHAVIHFAALKAVGESVQQPLLYYKNNLHSLINLLIQMQQHQIQNLVFSSSCTVYGQPEHLPVNEQSAIKQAESPYGQTKIMAEQIIADTVQCGALHAISLRYFNPVGAHDSGLIGELPMGTPNNLTPMIAQTAAGIQPELLVFGNDYNTPDGTCVRDYIHVVDLAKAHIKALERMMHLKQEESYEVFNLGTGKGYSVLETIKTFETVNKVKVNYRIAPRRAGDVEKVFADTKKANQILGWYAELDLSDMLRSVWKWQLNLQELTKEYQS